MVATDPNAPPAKRRLTLTAVDVVVLVAVAALLVFPLTALLAARAQPIELGPVVRLPTLPSGGERARLQPLPAGLTNGGPPPSATVERLVSGVSTGTLFGAGGEV